MQGETNKCVICGAPTTGRICGRRCLGVLHERRYRDREPSEEEQAEHKAIARELLIARLGGEDRIEG